MMGGALGLAVLASIAASRSSSLRRWRRRASSSALTGGYHLAFLVGAAFAAAAAVIGGTLLRESGADGRPRTRSRCGRRHRGLVGRRDGQDRRGDLGLARRLRRRAEPDARRIRWARAETSCTSGPFRSRAGASPTASPAERRDRTTSSSTESLRATGAVVMGRRMFSGGEGPWEDDTNANGWWGDDPPFHKPVFVLTHHAREPLVMEGGTTFTFVTEGLESAHRGMRAAAAGSDVLVAGGADAIDQSINAGPVDDLLLHLAPVLLGGGARLFDGVGPAVPRFEVTQVLESPRVTHLRYRAVPA